MNTDKLFSKAGLFLTILLTSTLLFTACSSDNNSVSADDALNVVETAEANGNFTILVQALETTGLDEALSTGAVHTVFAPTDEAFNNLPEGTLASLTSEQLAEILQFHVTPGVIKSTDLGASQDVTSLLGEKLLVESTSGVVVNNTANVTTADIAATNGRIHVIDEVLLPEGYRPANVVDQAKALGNFETLLGALESTGLTTTLKYKTDLTVFAPTDAALNNLPAGLLESLTAEQLTDVLTYHVSSGEVFSSDLVAEQAVTTLSGTDVFVTKDDQNNVMINNKASVAVADVEVSNGVIHAIDQVLIPDAYGSIVDAASKRYTFETLVSAVADAGLAGALSDPDAELTVLAPTDEAFAALPDGLLGSLTIEQLATILQYHVLPVEVASDELGDAVAAEALNGELVYLTVSDGAVDVNNAKNVVQADIATNNGIIHATDGVLLPNEFIDIVDIAAKNFDLTTLVTLLTDADLVTTLKGNGPFTVFAPTNFAFDEVSATLETLTAAQVAEVLTYHAAATEALSTDLSDGMVIPTVQGEDITVAIDAEGNVTLNGSVNVIRADQQGTNGVVHMIDGVLLPPSYQ